MIMIALYELHLVKVLLQTPSIGIQIKFKRVQFRKNLCGITVTECQWATRATASGEAWLRLRTKHTGSIEFLTIVRGLLKKIEKEENTTEVSG